MEAREQMNIVIVGHVDHGKSTVIGRLLADTGSLPEGKLESVKEFCRKNARPFEYAFLLDALKDEQAQGITIDTARCFFKTNKRDYIIIDAPGHVEFLKNMVTGASRAEAALLVIDAKEGIKENSKRHGHIVSMLGIKQVVVLVNKMDLVGFDREVYEAIVSEFGEFLQKVNIRPINYIPISAFNGDNIAQRSRNTLWYDGPTVLEQLDGFVNKKENRQLPFRMPVQDIYKFTEEGDDRRIVAGTIISGSISVGDEVVFLPSNKKSVIKSIEGFNVKPRNTAYADEAIGVTLTTQIYIKPGELMVKANEKHPSVSSRFRANIFWVGKAPLIKNKNYKLKIGTMKIGVKLIEISHIIDAAELNIDTFKDQVERHDVAECIFETAKPIAYDVISEIEQTGRFVIVDNYEISGGGIILEAVPDTDSSLLTHIREREFLWEKSLISAKQRENAYGHKAKFIVITSGSEGKEKDIQDIGRQLEERLFNMKYKAYYLGVSSILHGLASDVANSYEDRDEHIRQIGELARIFTDSGQIFITSIFNLDDYEAKKLKLLNQPNEIIVVNIGQTPFNNFVPDANIEDTEGAVEAVCELLKRQEIILEYYI
ncbi:MAG TPA: adenylyl-sulfate kinase [Hungateiclostridium thermocellum]|jgi:bifunctional enzyme CysN/CysC|uniref:sulfate adenylyltransferase n=2 Tax=Acetivibrio thermocellus TaxID=1515 RepID=A3DIG0_ACET2|nr:GTP-binding protein [Acetivibrio thermocellus]ABN53739.1 sulfate adenylyltransferase, large subunit [Acetivibrio thermocellus ATCC 27405]ADU73217.1 sulfate adenylyltransferase, large subunit [Acetivibrio thermocellus DSM 1313]ALX07132.1 sulfate adenylyltransferase, large subunit [Acetivibrio thermocellus AD2]ANV74868.1 sulfate adenylyltransferase, large subunit [Acetivibrio thermocellus DSM 2360]EIC03948.1 sulfate adenylyltransferase, large subunit [Acetivibrio thermocellus YS]